MKNRLRLTAGILVIVLFVLIIGSVVYINLPAGRYERYLNLGNRYLLSADYENAVRAFSKAIEIDAISIGTGEMWILMRTSSVMQ